MAKATIITLLPQVTISPIHQLGLDRCQTVFLQMPPARLVEHAVQRNEGDLTGTGALMCSTGSFTGRSPKDKYVVYDDFTADRVDWGKINQPFESGAFAALHEKMLQFLTGKKAYVRYAYAGTAPAHRRNLALVTTQAWQSLFCHHLFLRPAESALAAFCPEWTVLCVPEFGADPATDGTRAANFSVIDFTRKTILIGGTGYAGEIKKAVFTVMNLLLPLEGVLSMHCSANVGKDGDTALFFGLSGTGKTTLSADPERRLVGDDEHGWAGNEVFNLEGGCYAKVVNLSPQGEPQIYRAIRFGTLVENTRFHPGTQDVDYADQTITENTRAAYPLHYIPGAWEAPVARSPRHIFFLTADAFGVLPPVARLTAGQAMYHFLSGYTSKLAGTEMGVKEPVTTFSACFGAAFLPLPPSAYARLLGELIEKHNAQVWLVNTGWTGGPYGTGSRIKLAHTRSIIRAILQDELAEVPCASHEVFDLQVPVHCPGVPEALLDPAGTWPDRQAYLAQAKQLAGAFAKNYAQFTESTRREVRAQLTNA
ncbi:MAG: phosphoenolpyruvate carboxykinase (ATP) [Cytophagales bacterium]|nr:phosphoenolpyruvate carboxykinase (ATP) [Cytophagales bacterium]